MGGGATRLYSTLTQSLSSSSPLALPPSHLDPHPPADSKLDPAFCQVPPSLLSTVQVSQNKIYIRDTYV